MAAEADEYRRIGEEADVPAEPDEQTAASAEAAYNAVHYGRPDTRRFRKPRSIALLLLVVGGIVGLGAYAVVWSDNLRVKNEKIRLRVLEERHVMSTWQQKNAEVKQQQMDRVMPGMKIAPANSIYQPLNPQEKAAYDALYAKYGKQFEPDENEKVLIEETRNLLSQMPSTAPATAPATNPAGPS